MGYTWRDYEINRNFRNLVSSLLPDQEVSCVFLATTLTPAQSQAFHLNDFGHLSQGGPLYHTAATWPQPADAWPQEQPAQFWMDQQFFSYRAVLEVWRKGQRLFIHLEIKAFSFLTLPKLVSTSNQEYLKVDQKAARKKASFVLRKLGERHHLRGNSLQRSGNTRQWEEAGGTLTCAPSRLPHAGD